MQVPQNSLVFYSIIVILFILLLCTALVFFVFVLRRKEILQTKREEILQKNFQENLLQSRLEMQEETFKHISTEIHDNIGMSLSIVKLYMGLIELPPTKEQQQFYSLALEQLDSAIFNLKDLSHSMNADLIKEIGLLKSIEQELGRLRKSGQFTTTFDIAGVPVKMENRKEVIIFRIVQEALNNIMNHANASSVHLQMQYLDNILTIKILDDGQGFSLKELKNKREEKGSSGLITMEQRSELLQGNFTIESQEGKGTTLLFKVPL